MPLVPPLHPRSAVPAVILATLLFSPHPSQAQCTPEPALQNYTGGGTVACPCFVPGEQAGSVFTAPAAHYPIEILRVGIAWGSAFGGAPNALEAAVHVYAAGLPNPGAPIFSLEGPQLQDGFINEFNLEPLPGEIVINAGVFTTTLEFQNSNAGDPFSPTVVHDGNGCQAGKNVVFAIPGGWSSACALGVTGDWVFHIVYKQVNCNVDVEHELVSASQAMLFAPRPNPARNGAELEFMLPADGPAAVAVFDLSGRRVAELASGWRTAGRHHVRWDGKDAGGARVAAGIYLVELAAGGTRSTRKLTITE